MNLNIHDAVDVVDVDVDVDVKIDFVCLFVFSPGSRVNQPNLFLRTTQKVLPVYCL